MKSVSLQNRVAAVPLVFMHGWGSDSGIWKSLCALLPGEHLLIDLPGAGATPEPPVVEIDDWLHQLAHRLPERVVLIGWSLGGMLATRFTALYPARVAGLVTLASNPVFVACDGWPDAMPAATFCNFVEQFKQHPQATYQRFCALQAQGDGDRKRLVQALMAQPPPDSERQAAWQVGLEWLARLDNRAFLANWEQPSLHVFGQQDALVPHTVASTLANLPRVQTQVLPVSGHALPLAQAPEIARLIKDYCYSQCPPPIAKHAIADSFSRAAQSYDQAAAVQMQAALRLARQVPQAMLGRTVDLGCGTGFVSEALLAQGVTELPIVQLDLSESMVKAARSKLSARLPQSLWAVADAEQLPLASATVARVLSNFVLQWCADSARVLAEAYRVLEPGGRLLFSTLGPATLGELKAAWAAVDDHVHINSFKAERMWQAELAACGFTVLGFEKERLVAEYDDLLHLLRDLQNIGAHNMNSGRNPGLTSRARLRALTEQYEQFRIANGRLPASYDVFFVSAEKPR